MSEAAGSEPSGEAGEPALRADGALSAARELVDRLERGIEIADLPDPESWLDLRAAIGVAAHGFNKSAAEVDAALGLGSAKGRLKAYFLSHLGQVVSNDELSGVAGTHEWARRLRELALEEGWQITKGPDGGLKNGTYRLDEAELDQDKARQWAIRNSIRRQDTSARSRLLAYLHAIQPAVANKDDLAYVARISEWPRRMRELEEDGWDVISSVDDPSLPAGSYRLATPEQGPTRSRQAIKQRAEILQRDGWMCRDCGAGPTTTPGTVLQVHHIHQVRSGGSNEDSNLITLCRPCHAGRHAIIGADLSAVRDELLDPSADLGPEPEAI